MVSDNSLVKCLCGCGKEFLKYDNKHRKRKYIVGHANKNKKHNSRWKNKISQSMIGQVVHPLKTINCNVCGSLVKSHSPNRLYCDLCSPLIKKDTRKRYLKLYNFENREKLNNYSNERLRSNPSAKIAHSLRTRLRKVFKFYIKHNKVMGAEGYGIDYSKIINHLKPFPKDISKYHIDHIRPLCSFNFLNDDNSLNFEEIRKAFAPENHQWLLAKDNLKKGKKWNKI